MRPVSSCLSALSLLSCLAAAGAASVGLLNPSPAGAMAGGVGGRAPAALSGHVRASVPRRGVVGLRPGGILPFARGSRGWGGFAGGGYGFAPYGFGGYGYGYGSTLPITGATITAPVGAPLYAGFGSYGGPPDPAFPSYPAGPPAPPAMAGIGPSPVKPPAIYVVGGERRSARSRRVSQQGATPPYELEREALSAPRLIEVRPGRS